MGLGTIYSIDLATTLCDQPVVPAPCLRPVPAYLSVLAEDDEGAGRVEEGQQPRQQLGRVVPARQDDTAATRAHNNNSGVRLRTRAPGSSSGGSADGSC